MKRCTLAFACAFALMALTQNAYADAVSEVRVGVLAHDQAPIVNNVESGTDLNVEVMFNSPAILDGIGSPRPHVGATIASEGTSILYAGLNWQHDFNTRWFVSADLGLAAHDGDPLQESEQTPYEQQTEKALGCRVVLHVAVGAGYRFSPRWNMGLHYQHLSNATLCGSNEGLENIGVRVGYVF